MIILPPPHAVLNDARSPIRYRMQFTYTFEKHHTPQQTFIDRIVDAASQCPGGVLQNVVINCHGLEGYLDLGIGFVAEDAPMFEAWRGKVRKIWIAACLVGRRAPGARTALPSAMARAAQCYVIAGTERQYDLRRVMPYGQLDTYEGLVFCFGPDGRITWSRRYPSSYHDWLGRLHCNPD